MENKKEHKIKTINEIFEVVNEENVDCFLEDFSNFVRIRLETKTMCEMLFVPDYIERNVKFENSFNWIDDRKNDININVNLIKGESEAEEEIKLNPKEVDEVAFGCSLEEKKTEELPRFKYIITCFSYKDLGIAIDGLKKLGYTFPYEGMEEDIIMSYLEEKNMAIRMVTALNGHIVYGKPKETWVRRDIKWITANDFLRYLRIKNIIG